MSTPGKRLILRLLAESVELINRRYGILVDNTNKEKLPSSIPNNSLSSSGNTNDNTHLIPPKKSPSSHKESDVFETCKENYHIEDSSNDKPCKSHKDKLVRKKTSVKTFKQNGKCVSGKSKSADVFDYPDVFSNLKVENKAERKGKVTVNKDSRKRQSMTKIAKVSQSKRVKSWCIIPKSNGEFSIQKLKSMKADDNPRKNSDLLEMKSKYKFETEEGGEKYNIDLDELLKEPEDDTKSLDEALDEIDKNIMNRQEKYEQETKAIDEEIAAEQARKEETKIRMKENVLLRERLEVEVTEPVVKKMFDKNKEYLEKVWSGEVESSRHQAYHQSTRARHGLYYTMITDPFTDDHLQWTLDLISQHWMRNIKEQMDNNEYVWKVLLPECFIKFYMDHFHLDKVEAETRISETPLKENDDW